RAVQHHFTPALAQDDGKRLRIAGSDSLEQLLIIAGRLLSDAFDAMGHPPRRFIQDDVEMRSLPQLRKGCDALATPRAVERRCLTPVDWLLRTPRKGGRMDARIERDVRFLK